jgi:hypothetical protein
MKGRRMRSLFVQANRAEIVTEKVLKTLLNKPLTAKLLGPLKPQRGLVHRRRHRRGRADHHERPPTRTQPAGIQAMTGYPIRMGDLQTLHSELDADRISFIEFPPMAALRAFYFSDAYPPFTSNRAEDVLAFESNDRP